MTTKSLLYGLNNRSWIPTQLNSHGSLNVSLSAGGQELESDNLSGTLVTIDFVHHEIHEGEYFSVSYKTPEGSNLADNESISFVITTGSNKTPHIIGTGACGGDAEIDLYESPNFDADGTAITEYNHNRLSSIANTASVVRDPTINNNGTLLEVVFLPGGTGGNAIGEIGGQRNEWILKLNTSYLLTITNRAGNAQPAYLSLQWYEESI